VGAIIGWAPVSGDQPLSFSICSYNGRVTVGIATDTKLVPDYQSIAGGFTAAFDRIAAATPGAAQLSGATAP
jgi:diacylglycerol O-acyltransferase